MKYRLILSGVALALASISQAAYLPLPILPSSYNADSIVESNATPSLRCVTTATLDNGTNNTASTWNEVGYDLANPTFGLPAAGTVVTARDNANYTFQMPPTYIGNNGILVDGDGTSTTLHGGTFTLTSPTNYTLLSFAGSGGNGGDVIGVRVNHLDGTFETNNFGCPDWFGGSGVILATKGRMNNTVTSDLQQNGDNPRIYFRDITLTNTTSPVTSIVLSYVSGSSGSHNDVLAVSGARTLGGPVAPITVTGYTYDFVVEVTAPERGRVVSQTIIDGTNAWATTQTYDNDGNTGFTFYEKGHDFNVINNGPFVYGVPSIDAIAQASGIPYHGTTWTNGDGTHVFTMAPDYTTNCVVWVSPTVTNATITLATPTAASALSFLDAAGNGPVSSIVIVHHQNGVSETNSITVQDWFSGATPMYIPNGRVAADSGQWSQQVVTQTGADRLFASDLPLTEVVSPVTSIDLVYTNTGGRCGIYAVSALAGAVPPIITQQPANTNATAGTTIQFFTQVSGSVPFTFSWQKGTNGVFVLLSDGGNVSGATTTNLTISNVNFFSDAADYRFIVSNAGGSVTSIVATAILFSTNVDVTQPGDPISAFNANLFGDGPVANAIDNNLGTKYGANLVTVGAPIGLVVSPSVGATVVTGLRFFTANDAPERDPSDYKLEGSVNGGATYTLIASNAMTLPGGRNSGGGLDPLVATAKEVYFPNTVGYTTYKLSFSHLSGGSGQGSFQIGDVELLGVSTNLPIVLNVPSAAKAYEGTSFTLTASVSGTPSPSSRWQKNIAGTFTDLTDAGAVTGSLTPSLSVNPAFLSDAGQFRIIASNSLAIVTSAVVQVTIYSTNVDVTTPGDTVTDFGDTSIFTANNTPSGAINNDFTASFKSHGSGLNNNGGGDGFPAFVGPVGLVITPSAGNTLVTGVRIYTGGNGSSADPVDFKLEGSNNGGTTYTTILPTTALSLPDDRNGSGSFVDPLTTGVQEILFANSQGYTSYRLTFNNTKDNNNTSILSIGEVELLGVAVVPPPVISSVGFAGGILTVAGTGSPGTSYTVLTNANLTTPVGSWGTAATGSFDGSGNFTNALPVNPTSPVLFYRIKTP